MYTTITQLAKGSNSAIFLVEDGHGERFVEKRFLEPEPDYNEVDFSVKFTHPFIMNAIDHYIDLQGSYHLILPLADHDCYQYVIGQSPLEDALQVVFGLISAVHFMNENDYYHGDIKPHNILYFQKSREFRLGDFNMSASLSHKAGFSGTICYTSPQGLEACYKEGILFSEEVNNPIQTDIFSLGIVFFELYFGRPLIRRRNLEEIKQDYNQLEHTLQTMLADTQRTEQLQVLDCIYKMIRLSQKQRATSLKEVLKHQVFKGWSPVPGSMNKVSFYKIDEFPLHRHLLACSAEGLINSVMIANLPQLIRRTLYKRLDKYQKEELTLDFLAINKLLRHVCSPENNNYSEINKLILTMSKSASIEQLIPRTHKLLIQLEGAVRLPTLYELAESGQELAWFFLMCINYVDFWKTSIYSKIHTIFISFHSHLSKYDKERCMYVFDSKRSSIKVMLYSMRYDSKAGCYMINIEASNDYVLQESVLESMDREELYN